MFRILLSLRLKNVTCLAVPAIFLLSTFADAGDYLPLYRFYNTKIHQHEYTNSEQEAEQWRKDPDKGPEGVLGWLPTKQGKDVTRLYRVRSKVHGRHYYYTVKPKGLKNFEIEPTIMYVYKRRGTGRVAIHGTCLSGGEDMFFTKSKDEVDQVIEETKNSIGNKRRKFLNAFYILEENPEKKDSANDTKENESG